jgi:hypothetical protein
MDGPDGVEYAFIAFTILSFVALVVAVATLVIL